MDLENELVHITAPTLIVTTQESGLQSIATVERHAGRIRTVSSGRITGTYLDIPDEMALRVAPGPTNPSELAIRLRTINIRRLVTTID